MTGFTQVRFDHVGIATDVFWRSGCQHPAIIQHGNPVAHVHDQSHIVLDEDDGYLETPFHFENHGMQRIRLVDIHSRRRFIEQQQCR